MSIFGRKAKELSQSAERMEKLARKGRTEPSVTAPDGTRNGPAEIAKDRRHAAKLYRAADEATKK